MRPILRTLTRCLVCGFAEVRTDEVIDRGVVLLALAEADLQVEEYSPKEVKQAVCGYGGADKHQMQSMVKTLLSMPATPSPDDTADALAVAICHLHSYKARRLEANEP